MLVLRRNSLLYFTLFLILIALSCGLIFIYSSIYYRILIS